jgi:hypothetical protein
MPAVIKFYTDEYTNNKDMFATYDAIGNIASLLRAEGFVYAEDVRLAEVYYKEQNGRQIIAFEFVDERKAMLLKLKGINNG